MLLFDMNYFKYDLTRFINVYLPKYFFDMYIDTHAHLYLKHFKDDIEKVVHDAKMKGVDHIYMPNIDKSTTHHMLQLEAKFPDMFSSMMGVHPGSVRENYQEELDHVENELKTGKYIAVGEIGTDLYWEDNKKFKKEQILVFEQQISWALEYDLPIILHARDSLDLTIDIVSNFQNGKLKGIFHCFIGDADQAEKIMDLNFLMGIGGVITYKNSGLKPVVAEIPSEYIVLETDAPFLPPIPHRGRRNESAFLPLIAQHISEVQRCSIQEIAQITTANAKKLFGGE